MEFGQALENINSVASSQRKVKAGRLLNPRVYTAEYFGQRNLYDQNKKLGMYGATHVCARDGYSGMIAKSAAIPIKTLTITRKNTTNNNTKNP